MTFNNHGYAYIERWGRSAQSSSAYIESQCKLAKADNAPKTAINWGHDAAGQRVWRTVEHVTNLDALHALAPLPEGMRVVRLTGVQQVPYARIIAIGEKMAGQISGDGFDPENLDHVVGWADDKYGGGSVSISGAEVLEIEL